MIVPYLCGYGATRFLSDATMRNCDRLLIEAEARG